MRSEIRCAEYCGRLAFDCRRGRRTKKFAEAAHQAVRRDNMLHASVTALLEALAAIEGQIARLNEQLKELARRSPVCRRLMSVPGVGPIVALAFMAAIGDINRFGRMRSAHLEPLRSGCRIRKGEQRHDDYYHAFIARVRAQP